MNKRFDGFNNRNAAPKNPASSDPEKDSQALQGILRDLDSIKSSVETATLEWGQIKKQNPDAAYGGRDGQNLRKAKVKEETLINKLSSFGINFGKGNIHFTYEKARERIERKLKEIVKPKTAEDFAAEMEKGIPEPIFSDTKSGDLKKSEIAIGDSRVVLEQDPSGAFSTKVEDWDNKNVLPANYQSVIANGDKAIVREGLQKAYAEKIGKAIDTFKENLDVSDDRLDEILIQTHAENLLTQKKYNEFVDLATAVAGAVKEKIFSVHEEAKDIPRYVEKIKAKDIEFDYFIYFLIKEDEDTAGEVNAKLFDYISKLDDQAYPPDSVNPKLTERIETKTKILQQFLDEVKVAPDEKTVVRLYKKALQADIDSGFVSDVEDFKPIEKEDPLLEVERQRLEELKDLFSKAIVENIEEQEKREEEERLQREKHEEEQRLVQERIAEAERAKEQRLIEFQETKNALRTNEEFTTMLVKRENEVIEEQIRIKNEFFADFQRQIQLAKDEKEIKAIYAAAESNYAIVLAALYGAQPKAAEDINAFRKKFTPEASTKDLIIHSQHAIGAAEKTNSLEHMRAMILNTLAVEMTLGKKESDLRTIDSERGGDAVELRMEAEKSVFADFLTDVQKEKQDRFMQSRLDGKLQQKIDALEKEKGKHGLGEDAKQLIDEKIAVLNNLRTETAKMDRDSVKNLMTESLKNQLVAYDPKDKRRLSFDKLQKERDSITHHLLTGDFSSVLQSVELERLRLEKDRQEAVAFFDQLKSMDFGFPPNARLILKGNKIVVAEFGDPEKDAALKDLRMRPPTWEKENSFHEESHEDVIKGLRKAMPILFGRKAAMKELKRHTDSLEQIINIGAKSKATEAMSTYSITIPQSLIARRILEGRHLEGTSNEIFAQLANPVMEIINRKIPDPVVALEGKYWDLKNQIEQDGNDLPPDDANPPTGTPPSTPEPKKSTLSLEEIASQYFSYKDTVPTDDDSGIKDENGNLKKNIKNYVSSYQKVLQENPVQLETIKKKIRDEYEAIMKSLGIPSSVYGQSETWINWDLAKQAYLSQHPEESNKNYLLGNPFEAGNEKIVQSIIDRHVGWEVHGYALMHPEFLDTFKNRKSYDEIVRLVEEGGILQLPSYKLSKLGELIRENNEVSASQDDEEQKEKLKPELISADAFKREMVSAFESILKAKGNVASIRDASIEIVGDKIICDVVLSTKIFGAGTPQILAELGIKNNEFILLKKNVKAGIIAEPAVNQALNDIPKKLKEVLVGNRSGKTISGMEVANGEIKLTFA